MRLGKLVKGRKNLVQQDDQFIGWHLGGQRGKANQIGKQHGHLREPVDDRFFFLLQPFGDRPGQDIQQQPLRLGPLGFDFG